jgi:hypothetical protein
MRSTSVFEDFGGDCSRLERPGYGQNRGGFAFSPHFLQTLDYTPPGRRRTTGRATESVKYAG